MERATMQATQSRKASGIWRRNGQFAALRYVSRHLEIDAGHDTGDSVEWERGRRWGLLRSVGAQPYPGADSAGDAPLSGEGSDIDGLEHAYLDEGLLRQGYIARERERRAMEDSAHAAAVEPALQHETTIEEGEAGWIGC
jgi:hypothetical protein